MASGRNVEPNVDILIRRIESLESTQTHLNDFYADMCSCIFNEMDNNIQYSSQTKPMRKNFKNYKPYWTQDLTRLWRDITAA